MKLSIIVPVYNTKPYLKQCLESILNQTFADFELIIVDDGSTDGSGEIISLFESSDNRVRVVRQQNGGIVSAVKAGIRASSGDYISFVDSDDYCELNKYEILMGKALTYKCDMVACGIKSEENTRPCLANEGFYDYSAINSYIYKNCFLLGGYCCRYNKVIKRDVLTRNLSFYTNVSQANEDYLFFSSFFFNVKSLYICKDILCNVRTISNLGSTTKRNRTSIIDELDPLYISLKNIFCYFGKEKLLFQTHNLFFNSIKSSFVSVSREKSKNDAIVFIKSVCNMALTKSICKKISWRFYPTKHKKDSILNLLIKLKASKIIYFLARR